MRIAYVLSTCEKYLETRVVYQLETSLADVPRDDIYYLSCQARPLSGCIYGWNTDDGPEHITHKYIQFLRHMGLEVAANYDWVFFGDDDTYCFVERLAQFLSAKDPLEDHYIGHVLDHVQADYGCYMSGGAGYVVSGALFRRLVDHVTRLDDAAAFRHWCDDLCMGLWLTASAPELELHDSELFNVEKHTNLYDLKHAITFHHVHDRCDFELYRRFDHA